jgi:riboflavin synthase alpha subunit
VTHFPTPRVLTTVGGGAPGTQVNLEVDMIAKYVERLARGTKAQP